MRTYEMMIIFDRDAEDEERDAALASLEQAIQAEKGEITHRDVWGMRTFAYKINHKDEGFYMVLEFTVAGDLDELNRLLGLADPVVRYKILRLPDDEVERRNSERSAPAAEPKPAPHPAPEPAPTPAPESVTTAVQDT